MARVKRGVAARNKHKKILSLTKGYKHGRKNIYRLAKQAVLKAQTYSYRDRRTKKRTFRGLWIVRINAAVRQQDMLYKDFAFGLKKANITLNRKVLAHLAVYEPETFTGIVKQVKTALAKK